MSVAYKMSEKGQKRLNHRWCRRRRRRCAAATPHFCPSRPGIEPPPPHQPSARYPLHYMTHVHRYAERLTTTSHCYSCIVRNDILNYFDILSILLCLSRTSTLHLDNLSLFCLGGRVSIIISFNILYTWHFLHLLILTPLSVLQPTHFYT